MQPVDEAGADEGHALVAADPLVRAAAGDVIWFVNGVDAVDALRRAAAGRRRDRRDARPVTPARVVGKVTGTVKHPAYDARPLLALRPHRRGGAFGASFLAVDLVGAGIGDDVLGVAPARPGRELTGGKAPIRSLIVGILDAPPEDAL